MLTGRYEPFLAFRGAPEILAKRVSIVDGYIVFVDIGVYLPFVCSYGTIPSGP